MKSYGSIVSAAWVAGVTGVSGLLGAGLVAGGCGARRANEVVVTEDSGVRLNEARRLAAEGQAAQVSGNPDRAISLYQQSLAATRELGFVQNNLGLLLMEKDNYLEAVALFQEAADVIPESAKPLYNIGLAYSRRGWDEKAMGFFEKALAREPSDRDALRAAVLAAKRLDLVDDPALARVRRALMLETDPRWKRMQESEQFRIEGALARAKENAPLAVPADMPVGLTGSATERLPDRAAPGPIGDPSPVAAPGPVVPARRATPPVQLPPAPQPAPMNPASPVVPVPVTPPATPPPVNPAASPPANPPTPAQAPPANPGGH